LRGWKQEETTQGANLEENIMEVHGQQQQQQHNMNEHEYDVLRNEFLVKKREGSPAGFYIFLALAMWMMEFLTHSHMLSYSIEIKNEIIMMLTIMSC
jgi:PAS domain-containing protein